MGRKEIYASVEIADHEVRLIVGEFYDTRFNVLCIARAEIKGIENKRIVDEQDVVNGIMKTLKKAEDTLGYRVYRVLLALPSVNVERHNQRVSVSAREISKRIRLTDLQRGLNEAISHKLNDELELVNVGCIKYIANGITSRKMPIDEICEDLQMSVDLLYADKEIVYSYARCIEKAGLEIMDICLDSYAIAQESAVFSQTVDKYVILVNIARQNTTLSLFTHGKLVNCEMLNHGYGKWLSNLCKEQELDMYIGYRLLGNTCCMKSDEAKDDVIYLWSKDGTQLTLTEKQVCEYVQPKVEEWIKEVNKACQPIVDSGDVRYLLTGEGCELQCCEQLYDQLNAPWQVYVPQTVGARDASLSAGLGLFYSWKEQMNLRKDDRISVRLSEVDKAIQTFIRKNTSEDTGFTAKLKKILLS